MLHDRVIEVLSPAGQRWFQSCQIQDEGVKELCQSKYINYNEAMMDFNGITSKGMLYLSKSYWKNLTNLAIDGNNIRNTGCKYLSMACIPSLIRLNLAANGISSAGVFHLAKADWKELRGISLYSNEISFQAVRWLVRGRWKQMKALVLGNNFLPYEEVVRVVLMESNLLLNLVMAIDKYQINLYEEERLQYLIEYSFKERFSRQFEMISRAEIRFIDNLSLQ